MIPKEISNQDEAALMAFAQTSSPIGAMEIGTSLPFKEILTDQPTNQPTDRT